MSVDEVPAVRVITTRIRDLLTTARSSKVETTVEPPLPTVDLLPDVPYIAQVAFDKSHGVVRDAPSAPAQHAALETAARSILYQILAAHAITDPDFVDVWNLLDILQLCAEHAQADPGLSLWLIEELLDTQTINGCRSVFDYLESRRERLIGSNFTTNKRNTILRTCNELLRRLSRAEDAVFCGRVFIFLFQAFPLGDKSAVNLRGEFHIENVTTFDDNKQEAAQDSASMDVDDAGNEGQEDDTKVDQENKLSAQQESSQDAPGKPTTSAADAKQEEAKNVEHLYPAFWSLQNIFSNPPKAFDTSEFTSFKNSLELAVNKFQSMPKIPRVASAEVRGTKRKRDSEVGDLSSTFNPKYLTSRDLFELELSDLTFQRHVLVQALILLEFLLSLTPKARKKNADLKAQKAMLYNYTLSEEDTTWATTMKSTIADYLQKGPEGKFYHRMVEAVLSRDKNWVRWKMESCPAISRPPVATSDYLAAKSSAIKTFANKRLRPYPMGAINIDFLRADSRTNGLEALKDPQRFTRPETEALLKDVMNIDLDLEMVSREQSPEEWSNLTNRRAAKTWRALRLGSRRRFAVFEKIDESKTESLELLVRDPPEPEPEQAPIAVREAAKSPDTRPEEEADATVDTAMGNSDEQAADELPIKELDATEPEPVEESKEAPDTPAKQAEIVPEPTQEETTA